MHQTVDCHIRGKPVTLLAVIEIISANEHSHSKPARAVVPATGSLSD